MDDLVEDRARGLAGERHASGRHLVQHDPEGENIGAAIDSLAEDLFRRHVGDGSHGSARPREIGRGGGGRLQIDVVIVSRFVDPRDAEVEDLGLAAPRQVDVARLDVAVHDPRLMGFRQRIRHVNADIENGLQRERPGIDEVLEALALEKLHNEVGQAVVLADIMDRTDRGMVEGRGRLRLSFEAGKTFGVAGEISWEDFDGHLTVEARIPGTINLTHPAGSDGTHNLIGSELFAYFH
jgi:hypothetical protein